MYVHTYICVTTVCWASSVWHIRKRNFSWTLCWSWCRLAVVTLCTCLSRILAHVFTGSASFVIYIHTYTNFIFHRYIWRGCDLSDFYWRHKNDILLQVLKVCARVERLRFYRRIHLVSNISHKYIPNAHIHTYIYVRIPMFPFLYFSGSPRMSFRNKASKWGLPRWEICARGGRVVGCEGVLCRGIFLFRHARGGTLMATRFHTRFSLFRHFHQKRDGTPDRLVFLPKPRTCIFFEDGRGGRDGGGRKIRDIYVRAWRNQLGHSSVSLSRVVLYCWRRVPRLDSGLFAP